MTIPFISVVIPVCNASATLEECLLPIKRQSYPPDHFEVVIVDNNSTDRSQEIAKRHTEHFYECKTHGPAAARNVGVTHSRGEIVAFTDADCVADHHWLESIAKVFKDETTAGIGGLIEPYKVETHPEWLTVQFDLLSQEREMQERPCSPPFPITANAAYRKRVLEEVGPFDEGLLVGEDADMGWRVVWAGGNLCYCPEAKVRHRTRATFSGLYKQLFTYGMGTVALFKKHRSHFNRRWFVDTNLYVAFLQFIIEIPGCLITKKKLYFKIEPFLKARPAIRRHRRPRWGSIKYNVIAL